MFDSVEARLLGVCFIVGTMFLSNQTTSYVVYHVDYHYPRATDLRSDAVTIAECVGSQFVVAFFVCWYAVIAGPLSLQETTTI